MGERRLRDALALAAVALVAGAIGYGLRGCAEAEPRPVPRNGSAATASPEKETDVATSTDGVDLEPLRAQLASERDRRQRLETALRELREEASQLVAAYRAEAEAAAASGGGGAAGTASGAASATATQPGALPQPKGISMEALEAGGFGSYEAERIRERIESIVMRQLQLENHAKREGWDKTPRFAQAHRVIGTEFEDMREDYGEDRFDWILYASGRKNRIVVDTVFGESAAGQAGLEPGDLILRYDDKRVFNGRELRMATLEGGLGELVALEYERNGQTQRVFVPRGPVGVQLHEATLTPKAP